MSFIGNGDWEEFMKNECRKGERVAKIVYLDEIRLEKSKAKTYQKEEETRDSIRILAMDGSPGKNGTEGYMDDGSDSYKRFALDSDGKLHIMAEYPKSRYGDEYMFRQIMEKFDPYVFFLKEPVEVESMDLDILLNVYWNNYGG